MGFDMNMDLFCDLFIIFYNYNTGKGVVVSTKVFGGTVCYDICSQL